MSGNMLCSGTGRWPLRLVEHEVIMHHDRNLPIRVQRQELRRSLRLDSPVDEHESERHAELLEQDMRRQAGIARKVMELEIKRLSRHEQPEIILHSRTMDSTPGAGEPQRRSPGYTAGVPTGASLRIRAEAANHSGKAEAGYPRGCSRRHYGAQCDRSTVANAHQRDLKTPASWQGSLCWQSWR